MKRKYTTGTRWCFWRWTDVDSEYITRLHLIKTPWFAICLHWINKTDPEPFLHDHPVSFLSLILRGGYTEYRQRYNHVQVVTHRWYNWISASRNDRHSIIAVRPGTLTLCIMGPKVREWGFHTAGTIIDGIADTGWTYWRDYYTAQRASKPVQLEAGSCESRERGWMQTYSGRRFYPLRPNWRDVSLTDIIHGLSMTCRYGGHTSHFYSVAEHCVHVSRVVEAHAREAGLGSLHVRALAREALLHDSAEAYIGDMIRPLKHQPEMSEFRRCEALIEKAVYEHFCIETSEESHRAIKTIDDRILIDEIEELMQDPDMYLAEGLDELAPLGIELLCWSPAEAAQAFLDRFNELWS